MQPAAPRCASILVNASNSTFTSLLWQSMANGSADAGTDLPVCRQRRRM